MFSTTIEKVKSDTDGPNKGKQKVIAHIPCAVPTMAEIIGLLKPETEKIEDSRIVVVGQYRGSDKTTVVPSVVYEDPLTAWVHSTLQANWFGEIRRAADRDDFEGAWDSIGAFLDYKSQSRGGRRARFTDGLLEAFSVWLQSLKTVTEAQRLNVIKIFRNPEDHLPHVPQTTRDKWRDVYMAGFMSHLEELEDGAGERLVADGPNSRWLEFLANPDAMSVEVIDEI